MDLVAHTGDLDDEGYISHLEKYHPSVFADYTIKPLPGRTERVLHDRIVWERWHDREHRMQAVTQTGNHNHEEKRVGKDGKKEKKRRKHGGLSILETYWVQLDAVMDRLMEGPDVFEDRDPGKAEAYAHCIAIIVNPYAPDIEGVREEAVLRWETRTSDAALVSDPMEQ